VIVQTRQDANDDGLALEELDPSLWQLMGDSESNE
jgi:hypothetical protein